MPPLCDARGALTAVTHGDVIYVTGGENEPGRTLSSVETYRTGSNSWTKIKPMKTKRYYHSACVVNGCVYVVGGYNTPTIEKYDLSNNKSWMITTKTEVQRNGASVVTIHWPYLCDVPCWIRVNQETLWRIVYSIQYVIKLCILHEKRYTLSSRPWPIGTWRRHRQRHSQAGILKKKDFSIERKTASKSQFGVA